MVGWFVHNLGYIAANISMRACMVEIPQIVF